MDLPASTTLEPSRSPSRTWVKDPSLKSRLSSFIVHNVEPILAEWESVARTMIPPAETMSVAGLRDHAENILLAIAKDMESAQTEAQRDLESRCLAVSRPGDFRSRSWRFAAVGRF